MGSCDGLEDSEDESDVDSLIDADWLIDEDWLADGDIETLIEKDSLALSLEEGVACVGPQKSISKIKGIYTSN